MMAGLMAVAIMGAPVLARADEAGEDAALVKAALGALREGRDSDVLEITDPAVTRQAERDADTSRLWFCSHSAMEMLLYSAIGKDVKKPVTVLGGDACDALFLRAYALVNLKRLPEARAQLQALTNLAPQYSHYAVEYAFAVRAGGDLDEAMKVYQTAERLSVSPFASAQAKSDHASALRGIGFIQTEQGDLDGAEESYKASLKDEPRNPVAKNELVYIRQLRAGGAKTAARTVEMGKPLPGQDTAAKAPDTQ
jgi:tetratricopeptide (TPR) repeat protein